MTRAWSLSKWDQQWEFFLPFWRWYEHFVAPWWKSNEKDDCAVLTCSTGGEKWLSSCIPGSHICIWSLWTIRHSSYMLSVYDGPELHQADFLHSNFASHEADQYWVSRATEVSCLSDLETRIWRCCSKYITEGTGQGSIHVIHWSELIKCDQ